MNSLQLSKLGVICPRTVSCITLCIIILLSRIEIQILLENEDDGLDYLRKEYNEMLKTKVTASNALIQEKYITISINKKTVDDARTYFNRVGSELSSRFARLDSVCVPIELDERLKIIHDFYMPDDELPFRFDLKEAMQKGHDFKDTICPDSMECEKGYFRIGDKYAKMFYPFMQLRLPPVLTILWKLQLLMVIKNQYYPISFGI